MKVLYAQLVGVFWTASTNGLCSFLLLCSICQHKVSISSWGWNGTEIGCSGGGVEMEACIISEYDMELKVQVGYGRLRAVNLKATNSGTIALLYVTVRSCWMECESHTGRGGLLEHKQCLCEHEQDLKQLIKVVNVSRVIFRGFGLYWGKTKSKITAR